MIPYFHLVAAMKHYSTFLLMPSIYNFLLIYLQVNCQIPFLLGRVLLTIYFTVHLDFEANLSLGRRQKRTYRKLFPGRGTWPGWTVRLRLQAGCNSLEDNDPATRETQVIRTENSNTAPSLGGFGAIYWLITCKKKKVHTMSVGHPPNFLGNSYFV